MITINKPNCIKCGACCNNPCELIPEDLEKLMQHFKLSLKELFFKYLIAYPIGHKYGPAILMMVPVKVLHTGDRINKSFADINYFNTEGSCIFLSKEKNCLIHQIKPFGGSLLVCDRDLGEGTQFTKSQYYIYWKENQHLFEEIFPGYLKNLKKIESAYNLAQQHYEQMGVEIDSLCTFLNKNEPEDGVNVLT